VGGGVFCLSPGLFTRTLHLYFEKQFLGPF
jgi:hypothetical protein